MSIQKKMGGMVSEGGRYVDEVGCSMCSEGVVCAVKVGVQVGVEVVKLVGRLLKDCWKNLPQTHICWKSDLLVARQPLSRFL